MGSEVGAAALALDALIAFICLNCCSCDLVIPGFCCELQKLVCFRKVVCVCAYVCVTPEPTLSVGSGDYRRQEAAVLYQQHGAYLLNFKKFDPEGGIMRGSEDAASSVSARVCCPGNERWLEKKADKTRWQQGGFLVETGKKTRAGEDADRRRRRRCRSVRNRWRDARPRECIDNGRKRANGSRLYLLSYRC